MALRSLRGAAIVSGGASGLGRACVERLHGEGLRVLIADLDAERGTELAARLGGGAAFRATDVTDPDAVDAAVAAGRRARSGGPAAQRRLRRRRPGRSGCSAAAGRTPWGASRTP